MEHSIESHTRCVNELCRICENLCYVTKKQKKNNDRAHKCAQIATDIFLIYGIEVNQEQEDTYSKSICGKCFTKIRGIKRANSNTVLTRAQEIFNINKNKWCTFRETLTENCTLCSHHYSLAGGCIKRKTTLNTQTYQQLETTGTANSIHDHQDQPSASTSSSSNIITNVETNISTNTSMNIRTSISTEDEGPNISDTENYDMETSQSHATFTYNPDMSTFSTDETNICNTIPDQTTYATCTSLSSNMNTTCQLPFLPVAESTPIKYTQTKDSSTSLMVKNEITFSQSLSLSQDTLLSKEEEHLTAHLVKRKLNTDPKKQTIFCKRSDQPMPLQRVVIPRKSTQSVRTPTKRKRAKLLDSLRTFVAGDSHSSADTQLASELKRIPVHRKQDITTKASVKQKFKVSRLQALTMKEKLGLSWRQGRKHANLLKQVGIRVENGKSVRELSREIISNFVQVEKRLFVKEDTTEYELPYGMIRDLPRFVDSLLDSYDEQNLLTWREGSIPQDEIWVKIGGNHGKNSLKFTLQIANTTKPNARNNTVVIAIVSVRDTHDNMVRFLAGGLASDLKALQSHSWKNKKTMTKS